MFCKAEMEVWRYASTNSWCVSHYKKFWESCWICCRQASIEGFLEYPRHEGLLPFEIVNTDCKGNR